MGASYDVIRSQDPSSFETGSECVATSTPSPSAVDGADPVAGTAFFYLVRGAYDCPKGGGPLGSRSDGTARAGRACH